MFLISFSDTPDFIESIKQVKLNLGLNSKGLVLKKSNVSDIFKAFYSSDDI